MDFANGDVAINQIVRSLPKLGLKPAQVEAFLTKNPFTPKYPVVDRVSFLGVEVEVENVRGYAALNPFWNITDDGSLRNRGKEFITIPTRAVHIEQALTDLFTSEINTDIEFTERTSVHVHLNIRTLTPKQLYNLVLTYIIFEKALFNWVGHNREHSIFCHPLVDTDEIATLQNLIYNISADSGWNKYCALNLAPIWSKGTIEFRHLYGTKDIQVLMFWINCILALKLFALKTDPDGLYKTITTLNTSSEYHVLGRKVFGEQFEILQRYQNFEEDCYLGTSIIKERLQNTLFNAQVTQVTRENKFGKLYDQYTSHTNKPRNRPELWAEPPNTQVRRAFTTINAGDTAEGMAVDFETNQVNRIQATITETRARAQGGTRPIAPTAFTVDEVENLQQVTDDFLARLRVRG